MRRYFIPAVVFVVLIAATVLTSRANNAADPGDPAPVEAGSPLATPLLNVRRVPEWLRQPTTNNNLDAAVRSAISSLGGSDLSCLSVHRGGEPVAEVNPDTALIPGELQRLVTLAAFDTLGARGYTTEVVRLADNTGVDGILEGDLWLIGGADPVLSTAEFIDRFGDERARTSMEDLAAEVISVLGEMGITTISGSVIGDASKYAPSELVYQEDFWPADDVATNTVGPVAGLLVDNGFDVFPETIDAPVNSRSTDPAAHSAAVLTRLIEAGGIDIIGAPASGSQPDIISRESVATIESPSIADIARRALVDGTTAEMMYREIAVRSGAAGVQFLAALSVRDAMISADYVTEATAGVVAAWDGSGLSMIDRSTCAILIDILDDGSESLAANALPTASETDLATCAPTGLDSLHALASARDEVSAIAGRAVASNGDVLTFSLIVNWAIDDETGEFAPRSVCDGVLPALLDAIADHPIGPSIDQLSPLPVDAES